MDDTELENEEEQDIYKIISPRKPDGSRDWDVIRKQVYKKYPISELQDQLIQFRDNNLDLTVLNDSGKSLSKLCIHFFREEQYKAKNARAKYSPAEVLDSDELLEEAFEKIDAKPTYYNAGSDYKNFVSFITNEATMVSKVAIFSPNLARKIYEKWCPKFYGNVHDSSSGWGNRCQGAMTSKYEYNYYGTDPNSGLHEHYKEQADFIRNTLHTNSKTDFRCCGSEEFIPEWEGIMDISFTSPPYFNTEKYSSELTQSAAKCANYYSWRDDFMRPTIKNVYRYLKPGAYYLLNLKNLTPTFGSFPALNDWAIVAQQEGFVLEGIEIMHYQSTRQFGTSKKTGKKREVKFTGDKEPVLVLRKPLDGEAKKDLVWLFPNTIDETWENRNGKKRRKTNA